MKDSRKKKIMWKPEEDMLLKTYIQIHGEGNWAAISKKLGLSRGGKSCRLRWRNYLRPDIKHGKMSEDEEDIIIRMHKLIGNRWALIAGRLPRRTDNEVKNYWNTYLSKKTRKNRSKTKPITTQTSTNEVDIAIEDKLMKNNYGSCTQEEAMADVANKGELNKEYDDKWWFSSDELSGEIVGGQGSGAGNPSCGIMDMHLMMEKYDDEFMVVGGDWGDDTVPVWTAMS